MDSRFRGNDRENAMMKILVTHTRPHLDDVCGVWLYRKFVPGWQKVKVHFIATSAEGAEPYGGGKVDANPDIVHIGVARGKYDEHKGDKGESAATLVFKDLADRRFLTQDRDELLALRKVIAYVLEGDLGLRMGKRESIYELRLVILGVPDSLDRISAGCIMLDGLLNLFKDEVILDWDWRKKKIFRTRWGRGVGLSSRVRATSRAYGAGYVLVAQVDPVLGYRFIRADARSKVDLTAIFRKVKKLEPVADWYLHHSKRMLICGSEVAPQSHLSRLTLEELIALAEI